MIAGVAINGVMKTTAAIAVVAPLFVLAIPILDTSFVIMKRIKYGLPVYSPTAATSTTASSRSAGASARRCSPSTPGAP